MVVCFVVEFSVSIEQAVEEETEANPAKREELADGHRRAHASNNNTTTTRKRTAIRVYLTIGLLRAIQRAGNGFVSVTESLAPPMPFNGAGIEGTGLNVLAALCRFAALLVGGGHCCSP